MDKNNIPPYPGRPAEQDFSASPHRESDLEREENRLNASREALRRRLLESRSQDTQEMQSGQHEDSSNTINSWSSLLLSMVAPTAKKTAARHPYTLIAASALIGGYLAWSRPWRKAVGSVVLGVIVRNLVTTSVNMGSKNGGRILRNYLNRRPEKKYPRYQKQEHVSAHYEAEGKI